MCIKWCKCIFIYETRRINHHRPHAMRITMTLCHNGNFVSTAQGELFSSTILTWHPMIYIYTIYIYILPITKFVIFFWAFVSSQVCQVWELWDKNWYHFTWGLKRPFWCNLYNCVDTTSNITSQRAFFNISRLLTYLVHLFRFLSVWK